VIDDLLDTAKAMQGVLTVERRPVALSVVIENAIGFAQPAGRANQIGFELRLDPRSRLVEVDPQRLQRALANLMSNAVAHTEPGKNVLIWSYFGPEFVEIGVRNAGGGVQQAFLPGLAQDHSREADLHDVKNVGLGMTLAKQLVELHHGHIELRGAGHGAVASLVVRLPAHLARQPAPPYGSPCAAHPKLQTRLDGLHILLVEDDPDALEFLTLVLRDAGARVSAYSLAGPAFKYFVNAQPEARPDIVVSDVAMPVEDGYSFLTRMRAWEASNASLPVPAIAVTAFSREEDCRRALASGFDRHVAKPIDAGRLVDTIAQWS
jgi:CheY-like chemotaxis protein